jgi:4-oxalocrotonate tautomerase
MRPAAVSPAARKSTTPEETMPIVHIHLLQGRDPGRKRELIRGVTAAVVAALQAPPESVRVVLHEMAPENYGIAGLPVEEFRRLRDGAAKPPARKRPRRA